MYGGYGSGGGSALATIVLLLGGLIIVGVFVAVVAGSMCQQVVAAF